MNLDRAAFYSAVRSGIFGGTLSAEQVAGMDAIFDAYDKYGRGDPRDLGNIFGQTKRETGGRMIAISELGGSAYFAKYGKGKLAKQLGNLSVEDGIKYHGRGPVQITGRANYTKFAKILGADLVGNPDLALDPKIGAEIAVYGMINGTFTGKKLSDYFNAKVTDWQQARRIINGMDHADEVATFSKQFYAAVMASIQPDATHAPPPLPAPEPAPPPASKRPSTWAGAGAIVATTAATVGPALQTVGDVATSVAGTASQATGTATTVKNAADSVAGVFHFPPWVVAILGVGIAASIGYSLYLRHKLAKEQGV